VVIGLFEKFDLPVVTGRGQQGTQDFDHFRLILLGLFQKRARYGVGDPEVGVRPDQVGKQTQGRQIASLGLLDEDLPVLLAPEKRRLVRAQPDRLV